MWPCRCARSPGAIHDLPLDGTWLNHGALVMNLFNKLPGFVRSAPGLEQLVWRRLPAVLLWGTLLPLLLAVVNRWLAPANPETGVHDGGLLLWDYTMFGVVVLHWSLVLTLALSCFIVRVMKGPAYVADAYALPDRPDDAFDDSAVNHRVVRRADGGHCDDSVRR
jgi:hypothetical protein